MLVGSARGDEQIGPLASVFNLGRCSQGVPTQRRPFRHTTSWYRQ